MESTESDKSNMEQAHRESETITERENIPEAKDYDMTRRGYSGFLLIRCKHCGEIKGFYGKAQITKYKCNDCGGSTDLNKLKVLWMNCECGNRMKYLTNMTDRMFDVTCNRCGNPVAVEWNDKKEVYQPIGEK